METYEIYRDRFKDYVVVLAGAGNGIGRACSLKFAQEGAKCINCDIDEKGLRKTEEMIKQKDGFSESYIFDIGVKNEVEDAMASVLKKYKKIDVLVNSAGIAREDAFVDILEEDWLKIINVNLSGAFYITQPVMKNMIENRFGKIINITSQSGVFGRPRRTHYSASKFGMNGLTQSLALEVAQYGINVNAICPSRIESEMTTGILKERAVERKMSYHEVRNAYIKTVPIGRLGLPEDVASLAAYLATEEAGFITGQFISTSGGR